MDQTTALSVAVGALASYLTWVHLARFSRIEAVHRAYATRHGLQAPPALRRADARTPPTRKELPMTPYEAQSILLASLSLEMPFVTGKALEFALFKTYRISTISDTLLYTAEFKDPAKAGKRYVDTALLIFAFVTYPLVGPGSGAPENLQSPVDPRGAMAISRTNYLHSLWASKILSVECRPVFLNGGLSLRWKSKHGTYFSPKSEYEQENMVPTESCRDVAAATVALLLHNVPHFARGFGEKVVACLLYDRLREAVMIPAPPPLLKSIVVSALRARGFFIRHFLLPRSETHKVQIVPDEPAFPEGFVYADSPTALDTDEKSSLSSSTSGASTADAPAKCPASKSNYAPRMVPQFYYNEPWYMPTKGGLRGAVDSLLVTIGIWREDQVPGPKFKPEGFRLEQCGPIKFEGKGEEIVRKMAEEIQGAPLEGPYAYGGCPVTRCPFSVAK